MHLSARSSTPSQSPAPMSERKVNSKSSTSSRSPFQWTVTIGFRNFEPAPTFRGTFATDAGRHFAALHATRALAGPAAAIAQALDDFHDAAANGDEDRYFALLPDDAVFLGTDASERWTGAEFRRFALPYFQRPEAWTYVPLQRHVTVLADGDHACFDELLDNDGYGLCRGSGVLVQRDGRWVLQLYDLSIPMPSGWERPRTACRNCFAN